MSDPSLPPGARQPGPTQRPYPGDSGQQPQPGRPPQQYPQQPYPPQPYQQQAYQQQPPFAPAPQQRPPFPVRRPSEETRRDVEAAWGARMELGPDYEDHIAAGLAERVEQLAADRAAEVYQESERARLAARGEQSSRVRQFVLGIISLVMGVPITAIASSNTEPGLIGVAIAWGGIVGVNAVHALSNRRKKSA